MYEGIDSIGQIIGSLSSQQKVISNNIANWNTPGYVRQEYKFSDVLGNLNNPYETDLSKKMGAMTNANFTETDGQPVDISKEMVDMQKTYLNYSLVTRRISTVFNNIRRATQIGR